LYDTEYALPPPLSTSEIVVAVTFTPLSDPARLTVKLLSADLAAE